MKLKIIAALAVAASAAFADGEDETAATTLAGARIPVSAFAPVTRTLTAGALWDYMQPFAYRGRSNTTEKGGVWVDVGSPRTLTGVMFYPRFANGNAGIQARWEKFRVWGADAPGPYTSSEGLELVVSNYLGAASDQTGYNALTNFSGISAHRYYYFDNYNNVFNFTGMELWSDDPTVEAWSPQATDAEAGDYLFTGVVTNMPGGASGEVCVCVAAKDYDVDFAAWQANGRTFVQSGLKKGDSYSIAATGITSGRRYAREFVRVDGGEWFASNYTWQFAARGELATPKAYLATTNPEYNSTGTRATNIYDGSTTAGWVEYPQYLNSITFELDPTLDYAVIRLYPRDNSQGSKRLFSTNFGCWARIHDVVSIATSKDTEPDWSAAELVDYVTKRELWKIDPDAVPEMTWTQATGAMESIWAMPNSSGSYIDIILDRKVMSGARWLRVVPTNSNSAFNCREIELYTVKHGGFVFTVR